MWHDVIKSISTMKPNKSGFMALICQCYGISVRVGATARPSSRRTSRPTARPTSRRTCPPCGCCVPGSRQTPRSGTARRQRR